MEHSGKREERVNGVNIVCEKLLKRGEQLRRYVDGLGCSFA